MMNRVGRVGVAALVCLIAACKSDGKKDATSQADGGPEGDGGNVIVGEELAEVVAALSPLAEAQCSWLFKCCSDGELAADIGPGIADAQACASLLVDRSTRGTSYYSSLLSRYPDALGQLDRLGYGFDEGKVSIDADAVAACASYLEDAQCETASQNFCSPKPYVAYDDNPCLLRKLLVGKVPEGGVCSTTGGDVDCAPDLRCASVSSPKGVCVKPVQKGGACFDMTDCAAGLVCDPNKGACTAGIVEGKACAFQDPARPQLGTEIEPCASGLTCDTVALVCKEASCAAGIGCGNDGDCPEGLSCTRNVCGNPRPAGEPCYESDDCASNRCEYSPFIGESLCVAVRPVDAPCERDLDCESNYCAGEDGMGKCQAKLPPASPCDDERQCAGGTCDFTVEPFVCVARGVEGAACEQLSDCAQRDGFNCRSGFCRKPPFAVDVACQYADECESKSCVMSLCKKRGSAGEPCGDGQTAPPCDDAHFCDVPDLVSAEGTCAPRKGFGESCTRNYECYGSCNPRNGMLRCSGFGSKGVCNGRD